MALQDLTPQLRTRLSRMERAVGWFVILATALLVFGFAFYIYKLGQSKGWFKTKIRYQTGISSAAGLKEGNPVKMMGRDVGQITRIELNDPGADFNMTVDFQLVKPYYGYVWTDCKVRVAAGDFLGNRYLEVIEGVAGVPTVHETEDKKADGLLKQNVFQERKKILSPQYTNETALLQALNQDAKQNKDLYYTNLNAKPYWLDPVESPAVTERLEKVVNQVEAALPGILSLTNQLATVLSNSAILTANLSVVASDARPAISNLAVLTAQLNHPGALGELLLPTNLNYKLDSVLGNADTAMITANTNLENLNLSLINLANLTSNLNNQVQVNSNILSGISKAVVDADELVQGLKRHWLLRSAFKKQKTNKPPEAVRSPKERK